MSTPSHIERAKQLRENQTKAESLLWELLRGKQLCGLKFRRQHPVGPFIADFACVAKKLVVELDGGYHEHTCEPDFERQRFLEAQGWKVVRFGNEDVLKDVEAVTIAIARYLGEEFQFDRRPSQGSGIMSEKSPTRSHYSRPSRREGKDSPRREGKDSSRREGKDSPRREGRDSPRREGKDSPRREGKDSSRRESKDV